MITYATVLKIKKKYMYFTNLERHMSLTVSIDVLGDMFNSKCMPLTLLELAWYKNNT